MLQEKYNRRIFDEGTEDAIQMLSHLRSNVLTPLDINQGDNVLILNPDSVSLVEWLAEKASDVTVGMTDDYKSEMTGVLSMLPNVKKEIIGKN